MTSPSFRLEPVPVRHEGRRPFTVAAFVVALVVLSIVKPWAGAGEAQPDPAPPSPIAAAILPPVSPSPGPGPVETTKASISPPAPLAPGQVSCGPADWRIVTLGDFERWTVRTWIPIAPVAADGPGDASIPTLVLGASDIAGLGACAPSATTAAQGRASRILGAWRASAGAATTTYRRLTLSELDSMPSGGPAGRRVAVPRSVVELVRPVTATRGGRWSAGRYVLLLASPDPGPGLWIGVVIGAAGK